MGLWSRIGDDDPSGKAGAAQNLALLEQRLGVDPPAPAGAVLVDRRGYAGDAVSDGPAIRWRYQYPGAPDEFVRSYRHTLAAAGWTEIPGGNLRGQLANFSLPSGRLFLTLFAPTDSPYFVVSVSA